jgi:cytochrome c oxidase assembly factor CtaG
MQQTFAAPAGGNALVFLWRLVEPAEGPRKLRHATETLWLSTSLTALPARGLFVMVSPR